LKTLLLIALIASCLYADDTVNLIGPRANEFHYLYYMHRTKSDTIYRIAQGGHVIPISMRKILADYEWLEWKDKREKDSLYHYMDSTLFEEWGKKCSRNAAGAVDTGTQRGLGITTPERVPSIKSSSTRTK